MNQLSLETLKALIELNSDINSDYNDKDALFFRVLKAAMRLIRSKAAFIVTVENGAEVHLVYKLEDEKESKLNKVLELNSLFESLFFKKEKFLVNDVQEDLFFSQALNSLYQDVDSFMFYPLKDETSVNAAILLVNKIDYDFDEKDDLIMEQLAKSAKAAYESFFKIQSQLESISNLNAKVSSAGSVKLHPFIAESPVIKDLMNVVRRAAITNSSILITGESGVGKELFAEQIYLHSSRVNRPFIRVNCAALTETLMESELFGHIKGAYTSAESTQKGRFEMADGGTIFLDEVGEIPLQLQPKLLRIIQDKQFEKVGSSESISVDVRIIAATNRNLEEMVRQGRFREDLFFRLNVMPIRVPPLRARVEDILPISKSFLTKYNREYAKKFTGFSEDAVFAMQHYYWPGNIRELDNAIARACIVGNEPVIQKNDLRLSVSDVSDESGLASNMGEFASVTPMISNGDKTLKNALAVFKRAYLIQILEECNWNQTKAGKVLGIQRTYVSRLMNELHIRENNGNK